MPTHSSKRYRHRSSRRSACHASADATSLGATTRVGRRWRSSTRDWRRDSFRPVTPWAGRTRGIGVRMALGASRRDVHRMVLWDGCSLAVAGVAAGIPCALLVAPVTRSLLYGLAPGDPVSLVGASLLFVAVAVAACWIP